MSEALDVRIDDAVGAILNERLPRVLQAGEAEERRKRRRKGGTYLMREPAREARARVFDAASEMGLKVEAGRAAWGTFVDLLTFCVDHKTCVMRWSLESIDRELGIPRATFHRHAGILERAGLLIPLDRHRGGGVRTYWVPWHDYLTGYADDPAEVRGGSTGGPRTIHERTSSLLPAARTSDARPLSRGSRGSRVGTCLGGRSVERNALPFRKSQGFLGMIVCGGVALILRPPKAGGTGIPPDLGTGSAPP